MLTEGQFALWQTLMMCQEPLSPVEWLVFDRLDEHVEAMPRRRDPIESPPQPGEYLALMWDGLPPYVVFGGHVEWTDCDWLHAAEFVYPSEDAPLARAMLLDVVGPPRHVWGYAKECSRGEYDWVLAYSDCPPGAKITLFDME